MIRYDCNKCGENVFEVVNIEHLGIMPHKWVCSGCGRIYRGVIKAGKVIVYRLGHPPKSLRKKDGPRNPSQPIPETAPDITKGEE